MTPKFRKLFFLWLLLQFFLPGQIVLADTGPKPTMDFQFKQELTDEQVTITSGILYECEQANCSDATPLQQVGPQRFTCDANSCSATAYGFAPYHQIEIEFSDGKTRQSNIFETAGFDSKYTVTVHADDLLVEAEFVSSDFPFLTATIITCICALVGLGVVAVVIIFLVRRSKKN
jgi:hypothetical protein